MRGPQPDKPRFLEALGHLQATNAPGMPLGVEAVAAAAGLDRGEAIRVGLELIDDGWITGVVLPGDDEIKTINGLELSGIGRRELSRLRGLRFMLELEAQSNGDPDADVPAGLIAGRLGWTLKEGDSVAAMLADGGLIEFVEMGSDLVTITDDGRRQLDRAIANDRSPTQQIAPVVFIGQVSNGVDPIRRTA